VGYLSGHGSTANSYSTFLGYNARSSGLYTNSTAIGASALVTANNQVRVGDASVTSIGGFSNWTNVSDGRFKRNVQENVAGLAFILNLRPVTYNLDMDAIADFQQIPVTSRHASAKSARASEVQSGFIAQEVETVAHAAGYDFHGVDKPQNEASFYGLRYAEFVVPLVKAVQELHKKVERLESENADLKMQADAISALQAEIAELRQSIKG
jgi:hypothetical protein